MAMRRRPSVQGLSKASDTHTDSEVGEKKKFDAGEAVRSVGASMEAVLSEAISNEKTTPPPAPSQANHLPRGMERIVRSIFDIEDLEVEFEELRKKIKFDQRASSLTTGQLVDALDEAGENGMRAAELLANAQVVLESFDAHAEIIESGLQERAHEELTELKEAKKYKGRFSKADVESMMAKIDPVAYRDAREKRAEAKRTVDVLDSLVKQWFKRQDNVRAMLSSKRGD